ncbi:MAG: DUF397 domain-containing protein [Pseudonocardiaceae bacterium]
MMTAPEPGRIVWQKSSYSAPNGDCVEIAPAPDRILIRDSKDSSGPALAVPIPVWRTFLTTLVP